VSTITDSEPLDIDIDIACSLSAAEKAERGQEFSRLFADAEDVAKLADGYALKFPNRHAWVIQAAKVIIAERKCCPFFVFTLDFEVNGGPVWLHVRGPGAVKAFIRESVVPPHLRPVL
jgi:hypothetical protein